jgi:hypothetical protein
MPNARPTPGLFARATPRHYAGKAFAILFAFMFGTAAQAQSAEPTEHESLDDAWWTGPLLASTAATLPEGHYLTESYLNDSILRGDYTPAGDLHRTPREDSFESMSYLLYGLTDRITVGLIPRFGYHDVTQGQSSAGPAVGDITLQAQYRFTQFQEGSSLPTLSLVAAETLPNGRYDRLDHRPSDGFGQGAYTTTLSLYSQYCLWVPNGRILRTRLDVSYAISNNANVQGVSVYGTPAGFRGDANPGDSITADSAWEYSVTRHWVLALDVLYQHGDGTLVSGSYPVQAGGATEIATLRTQSGPSKSLGIAPAAEYNWSGNTGLIVGVLRTVAGRNASAITLPAVGLNVVF